MIETERTVLRSIKLSDSEKIFAYRSDVETNKYQGWIPDNLKDVVEFISKISNKINTPQSWFQFVIVERGNNEIIGDVGIHFSDVENFQSEIGITLNKKYHRKGYATEIMKSVIDYLFSTLKKHRIYTSIDPENSNSIKLLERLGFRKEAYFKESYFNNGKWTDDVVYAMLNKEWIK